jgi:hypothetical protein
MMWYVVGSCRDGLVVSGTGGTRTGGSGNGGEESKEKAGSLTYSKSSGTSETAAGTRLGLDCLAVSQPLPATLSRSRDLAARGFASSSWLQHHHDATHQPSLTRPLRSPPFPPFLSPPIFLSLFWTRSCSISRLSGAFQPALRLPRPSSPSMCS